MSKNENSSLSSLGREEEAMRFLDWLFRRQSNRGLMAKNCGHICPASAIIKVFGTEVTCVRNPEAKEIDWCPECRGKAAIQCAWCGGIIMPDEPITLYTAKESFKIPKHAVIHQKGPLQLVGCLRWDCACTGADRAGFWIMPGKVQRLMSPLEQALLSPGGMVIVSDQFDRQEAINAHNAAVAAVQESGT